jgi:electron transport complex protein RnfB
MAVVAIDLQACINCGWCRRVCPTEAIVYFKTRHRTHVVEQDACIDCGLCMPVCPVNCIYPVEDYTPPVAALDVARGKARAHAAADRKIKANRAAVVERTLAKLAARSS